jgi:cysteine synthase
MHVERSIVPADSLVVTMSRLMRTHPEISAIIIGSGTGSGTLSRAVRESLPNVPVVMVDERGTSLLARERYMNDHPVRGWKRLIPPGLLVPPEPYDDYAALLLAERYLLSERGKRS